MFKKYSREIREILKNCPENVNWSKELDRHQLMLARIQRERLIHLIVTVFVGLCMVLCFLTTAVSKNLLLACLDIPLIVLFTGYIFHYRFLENTTQSWYKFEDKIKEKIDPDFKA